MSALQDKYGPQGLQVLAVNAWNESATSVEDFVRDNKLKQTVLLSGKGVFKEQYKGMGIPHTYLIDKSGVIRMNKLGWDSAELPALEAEIQKLL